MEWNYGEKSRALEWLCSSPPLSSTLHFFCSVCLLLVKVQGAGGGDSGKGSRWYDLGQRGGSIWCGKDGAI